MTVEGNGQLRARKIGNGQEGSGKFKARRREVYTTNGQQTSLNVDSSDRDHHQHQTTIIL